MINEVHSEGHSYPKSYCTCWSSFYFLSLLASILVLSLYGVTFISSVSLCHLQAWPTCHSSFVLLSNNQIIVMMLFGLYPHTYHLDHPPPPTQTHRRHTTPLPPAILAHSSLPKSQRGFLCSCPSAVTFPFDFCGQIYRAATVVCQNCVSHLIYVGGFLPGRLSPHRADL